MKFVLTTLTTPFLILCLGLPSVLVLYVLHDAMLSGMTAVALFSVFSGICGGVLALLFRRSLRSWRATRIVTISLLAALGAISVLWAWPAQVDNLVASSLGSDRERASGLLSALTFLAITVVAFAMAAPLLIRAEHRRSSSE